MANVRSWSWFNALYQPLTLFWIVHSRYNAVAGFEFRTIYTLYPTYYFRCSIRCKATSNVTLKRNKESLPNRLFSVFVHTTIHYTLNKEFNYFGNVTVYIHYRSKILKSLCKLRDVAVFSLNSQKVIIRAIRY